MATGGSSAGLQYFAYMAVTRPSAASAKAKQGAASEGTTTAAAPTKDVASKRRHTPATRDESTTRTDTPAAAAAAAPSTPTKRPTSNATPNSKRRRNGTAAASNKSTSTQASTAHALPETEIDYSITPLAEIHARNTMRTATTEAVGRENSCENSQSAADGTSARTYSDDNHNDDDQGDDDDDDTVQWQRDGGSRLLLTIGPFSEPEAQGCVRMWSTSRGVVPRCAYGAVLARASGAQVYCNHDVLAASCSETDGGSGVHAQ